MLTQSQRARDLKITTFSNASLTVAADALQAWFDTAADEEVLGVDYHSNGTTHWFVVLYVGGESE